MSDRFRAASRRPPTFTRNTSTSRDSILLHGPTTQRNCLAGVSAFANSRGGDLVCRIEENSAAGHATPLGSFRSRFGPTKLRQCDLSASNVHSGVKYACALSRAPLKA